MKTATSIKKRAFLLLAVSVGMALGLAILSHAFHVPSPHNTHVSARQFASPTDIHPIPTEMPPEVVFETQLSEYYFGRYYGEIVATAKSRIIKMRCDAPVRDSVDRRNTFRKRIVSVLLILATLYQLCYLYLDAFTYVCFYLSIRIARWMVRVRRDNDFHYPTVPPLWMLPT